MPPKGRNHNPSGLGRAIINRKIKDAQRIHESGLYITDISPRLDSITQERDLDAFLNDAELAGTEFTAERRNVKVIQQNADVGQNPYLLDAQEESKTLQKHQENKQRLRVPRRPRWTKSMKPAELERQEKDSFLNWRRGLAQLQEEDKFLLTPFERNIEVWRQLWRVLERSHLVVQIVDARNPLRFRCEDLENYVHDIDTGDGDQNTMPGKRRSLLLLNKADLLTKAQRLAWAEYFDAQKVEYAFFSAANATAIQEARKEEAARMEALLRENPENGQLASEDEGNKSESESEDISGSGSDSDSDESGYFSAPDEEVEPDDPKTKVLSVLELESLFRANAPNLDLFTDTGGVKATKLVIGLVGYPNVGKSSTINSLLGEKKVSVSSTPGKTKHFQTIHLSETMVLCDCPGLVFPQFATTKAELVCDGVLPIDQMREYTGPISLVVKRIPKTVLEATYGLNIRTSSIEEGGDGKVTAENFLIAYAIGRGFMRSGQGNPDEARSARYILKDLVNAKIRFCHPPPDIDENEFNHETHENALQRLSGKKKAPTTRVGKGADTFVDIGETEGLVQVQATNPKSKNLDRAFFNENGTTGAAFVQGKTFSRAKLFPHQNMLSPDGTPLPLKYARMATILANQDDIMNGKKQHKKMKRVKQRSGKGYD